MNPDEENLQLQNQGKKEAKMAQDSIKVQITDNVRIKTFDLTTMVFKDGYNI